MVHGSVPCGGTRPGRVSVRTGHLGVQAGRALRGQVAVHGRPAGQAEVRRPELHGQALQWRSRRIGDDSRDDDLRLGRRDGRAQRGDRDPRVCPRPGLAGCRRSGRPGAGAWRGRRGHRREPPGAQRRGYGRQPQAPPGCAGPGERPPWNPPGRRWRLAGKPAGLIARAGLGERRPWNPPGRRWRLAGKPAGLIARAGSGGRPSGPPGWPQAPFLRHGDLARPLTRHAEMLLPIVGCRLRRAIITRGRAGGAAAAAPAPVPGTVRRRSISDWPPRALPSWRAGFL